MLTKLRKIFFYFFSVVFFTLIVVGLTFFFYGRDLPNESTLLEYSPPTTTKIYSRDGELIEEYAIEHRVLVPFNKIPLTVKGAFLIAEDRDFYSHSGISVQSLLRAIIENTAKKSWHKKPAGGSTITQQIAKNLLVGSQRSITRKIKEAIMAFRIEGTISKDKILEIYLNQIYLGRGCYGISEACEHYFGKSIGNIAPEEAAFLASIPSAPSIYDNLKDSSKILSKRNSVLYQMHEFGYISKEQLKDAISKPIVTTKRQKKLSSPFFSDEIFRIFAQKVSKDAFLKCGYNITTTMNKAVQQYATKSLEDGLIEFTKTKAWHGTIDNISVPTENAAKILADINKELPTTINKITSCVLIKKTANSLTCQTSADKKIEVNNCYKDSGLDVGDVFLCRYNELSKAYELYQTPEATGGIVVMDPTNGEILGMSGGYSFDISSFNCITQAKRQPGSTIKPFVYSAALEDGMDEFDIIHDKPVHIKLSNGETYSPQNYNGKCFGDTPLRDGIIYSRNLSTVNLTLRVGMNKISNLLRNFDLTNKAVPISAVLGSIETTPINIISAFSAFLNEGNMVYPKFILSINQSNEKYLESSIIDTLYKTKFKNVISKKSADTMKNILHDACIYGTSSGISQLEEECDIELGGKTGTTNDFKDAWFIGYFTKDKKTYLVCVFIGYPKPKSLGDHNSGAKVALPIFSNFVKLFCEKS